VPARHAPARRLLLLTAALAAAALLLVGGARAEAAATITVDILEPGTATDGKCSLAEALQAAETDAAFGGCTAGSGDDTINIGLDGTITAPNGGFQITSNVTVQGHADGTTVSGGGGVKIVLTKSGTPDTVNAKVVKLADLTVTGAGGAGVTVRDDSDTASLTERYDVVLENLLVEGNTAEGIKFEKEFESVRPGLVHVKDSVIKGNDLGGVSIKACDTSSDPATLKLTNSSISGNTSPASKPAWSGGLTNLCGRLEIRDSTVSRNEGPRAAVWANHGDWQDPNDRSSAKANTITVITNSTIADNRVPRPKRSDNYGGGIHVSQRQGGGFTPLIEVQHVTITRNEGDKDTASGIHLDDGVQAGIRNSVITGNRTIPSADDPPGNTVTGRQCRFLSPPGHVRWVNNASAAGSCWYATLSAESTLGSLADNGESVRIGPNGVEGRIETIKIDFDSLLFGTANAEHCRGRDARGVSRPQGFRCDIGAYEAKAFGIGGDVWVDADGNSVQDDGESPFVGVTLNLVDAEGEVIRSATTDNEGSYSFDVPPGTQGAPRTWEVRVTGTSEVLSGYRATTPSSLKLPVSADRSGIDFGYISTGSNWTRSINVNTLAGDAPDGRCSLVEAIRAANTDEAVDGCLAGSGDDTTNDDTINIAVAGSIDAPAGGFRITSNVTVQGHADGTTVSDGGGFSVVVTESGSSDAVPATRVKLADLTVTGSSGPGVEVVDYRNASVDKEYTVILENLDIEASDEDGVYVERYSGSSRSGHVEIGDSVIEGGSYGVHVGSCGRGSGGVKLTVTNSVIRGNSAGGVYNLCGSLRLVRSLVSDNSGPEGGVYSRYRRQPAGGDPPGTEIINSTIADNESKGIVVSQTGAVRPELSIVNSTIAANTDPDSFSAGIRARGAVSVSIVNTVVADNGAGNSGAQCRFASASLIDPGNADSGNASSDGSCGFALESIVARLWPLQDNGGTDGIGPNGGMGNVLTMAVRSASPLLGAADVAACPDKDGRGLGRPQGSGCDIGAYEAAEIKIGDRVWLDADGGGDQDPGEGPIAGVTVDLVGGADTVVASAKTDADGEYGFRVLPGTWTVRVTDTDGVLTDHRPPAEASKTARVGADNGTNLGFDFGYRGPVTIGDYVWVDANGNGVQDAGETPLEGVTVQLSDTEGDVVTDTTTGNDGRYEFHVPEGTWTVRVIDSQEVLSAYQATTPSLLTLSVTEGSGFPSNFDFGYISMGSKWKRVINVNKLTGDVDDGRCSLAEAINAANTDEADDGCLAGSGDDTINISKGGEIESTGSFKIESNVTIQGHSGGSTVRGVPFQVVLKDGGSSGSGSVPKVTLADLTITGAGDVGVLIDDKTTAVGSDTDYSVVLENLKVSGYNFGVRFLKRSDSAHPGSVEIKSSVVTGNRYWGVDWWDGSGAESVGVSLTVANSELRENSEGNHGGGGLRSMNGHVKIFNSLIGDNKGYGVYADRERSDTSDTEIVNTTIDGNRSDGNGNDGGVHVRGSGTLKIDNSTITRNGQGGVYADSPADVSVSITNTVIAKNTDVQCSSGLTLTVNEGNASSDASCGFTLVDESIGSGLGELADNGGAAPLGPNGGMGNVRTRAVGSASRLLDAGHAATCRATDARGLPRPSGGAGCDIGAYEAQ